jgi:hypothetical protein
MLKLRSRRKLFLPTSLFNDTLLAKDKTTRAIVSCLDALFGTFCFRSFGWKLMILFLGA